jgi:hypothetical protein
VEAYCSVKLSKLKVAGYVLVSKPNYYCFWGGALDSLKLKSNELELGGGLF